MASLRLLLSLALIGTANTCYGQGDIESKPPAESIAPYAIGSMTRFFHDEARGFDTVGGSSSGVLFFANGDLVSGRPRRDQDESPTGYSE